MESPAVARDAVETEIVERPRIACDGSSPALGHPRVWLQISPETGYAVCGYCDKMFILKGGPADPTA